MRRRLAVDVAALFAAGCKGSTPPENPPPAALEVRVSVAGTAAASVVARVTAPDLPQALVFQLAISNGQASRTIEIPAGAKRTILVHVSDAKGIETHRGATTVDVRPGSNPAMAVELVPVTVNTPITVAVGQFVVAVTPSSGALSVGETVRLQAAIADAGGAPVSGRVSWASTNPAIVSVDASGLITARRPGTASIVAVYGSAVATATITVRAGSG
jgi:hypothetical protein